MIDSNMFFIMVLVLFAVGIALACIWAYCAFTSPEAKARRAKKEAARQEKQWLKHGIASCQAAGIAYDKLSPPAQELCRRAYQAGYSDGYKSGYATGGSSGNSSGYNNGKSAALH
jgi:flagellar biosynthesis/type III secretory pathway protein FliH